MRDTNAGGQGSTPELQRRGPLNTSNPLATNAVKGEMVIGPCRYVDKYPLDLLAQITQKLYAVVAAARTFEPKDADERKNALHHVLVATLGIAATQAETIVTLVSCDLHKTAEVHIRSLGESAKRCKFLLEDASLDVALAIFGSLEASRKALAGKVPAAHELREIVDKLYAEVNGPTMEAIERRMDRTTEAEEFAISSFERTVFSKWAHSDIVALADAGDRIRGADEDLRKALNVDATIAGAVLRSITFALILLACGHAVKINTSADVEGLAQKSEEYARATMPDADRLREAAHRWMASQSTSEGTR